jgi:serine protease Do
LITFFDGGINIHQPVIFARYTLTDKEICIEDDLNYYQFYNKEIAKMKKTKLLMTAIIVPVLLLAGCTGMSLSLQQPALNSSAQVAVAQSQPNVSTSAPVAVPAGLNDLQNAFEQVYQQVSPSVVNIQVIEGGAASANNSSRTPGFPFSFGTPAQQAPSMALGSGFVWDTSGNIVTNNHVVSGASKITVKFADGMTVNAKVVGTDPNADLAVINVSVPASELHPVSVADSTQVKVGQIVIAIGNPFGLQGTMTQGIISGLSRSLPVDNSNSSLQQQTATYSIPDIIQTDASINPGNSGGVLVNAEGQLIGVTSAIESNSNSSSGVGFVIPSQIVNRVVPSIIKTGTFKHPYLGISGTSLTPDLASAMKLDPNTKGTLVVDITPNGPAANAGIKGSNNQASVDGLQTPVGGDVITAINGQQLSNFEDLASYLFNNTNVGETVTLTVIRNGAQQNVKVTLGQLPTQGQ